MDISSTVDWISATDHSLKGDYPGMGGELHWTHGLHSYTEGARYDGTGLWVMWSPERPEMGVHLNYSGETIRAIRANGMPPDALLKALVGFQLKFTRLDLAIDLKDTGVNLEKLKRAIIEKAYEGRERKWHGHDSSGDGYSIYVGSPRSDRILRIYDKAAEQGLARGTWKRLELQLRRKVSQAIAYAYSNESMGSLHSATWAIADKMVPHLRSADWREFGRDTDAVGVPSIPRQSNTENWLIHSIAPAIAKFRKEYPDSIALLALKKALGTME